MTDKEIDDMIDYVDRMAQRIGCRFVPDPDKLMAFRCAQREEEAVRAEYRKLLGRRSSEHTNGERG